MVLPTGIAFDFDPVTTTAPNPGELSTGGSRGLVMRAADGDAANLNLLTNPLPRFDEGWTVAPARTRKNYAKYPTPESLSSPMTGWTGLAGTSGSGSTKVVEVPAAHGQPARFAFAWQWNVASPLNGGGGVATTLGNIVDLVPGTSMRFTVIPFIVLPSTGGRQQLVMNIQWVDAGGSILSTSAGTGATLFSQFAISRVATVPANATQAIVQIYRTTGGSQAIWSSGAILGIANLIVEEDYTGPALPWFCGSSPGAQWDGTPYASTAKLIIPDASATTRQIVPDAGRRGVGFEKIEYTASVTDSKVVGVIQGIGVFTNSSEYEITQQIVYVYTDHTDLKAVAYGRSHFGASAEADVVVDLLPGEWTPVRRRLPNGDVGADKKNLFDFKVMILADAPVTGDFTFSLCDAMLKWSYGEVGQDYQDGSMPGLGWEGDSFHSRTVGKASIIDDPAVMAEFGIGRPAFLAGGGSSFTSAPVTVGGIPPATVAIVLTPVEGAGSSNLGYPAANNSLYVHRRGSTGTDADEYGFTVAEYLPPTVPETVWFKRGPVVLVGITEANKQTGFVNGAVSFQATKAIQDYGPVSPVYLTAGAYYHRVIAWDRVLNEGELASVFADLAVYLKSEVNIAWDDPEDWGGGDAVGYVVRTWTGSELDPVEETEVPYGTNEATVEVVAGAAMEIVAVSSLGRSTPVAVIR